MSLSIPLVSVIIPTYNCELYLVECLNSILTQSYTNIEILVVDDGSTDNTSELVQKHFPNVRYFYKPNGGLASARNFGHANAKGEYIAWMDADDIALPPRISLQVEVLQSMPEAILVNGDFDAFDTSGQIYQNYSKNYFLSNSDIKSFYNRKSLLSRTDEDVNIYTGNLYHKLLLGNIIHPPTIMFRSAILGKTLPLQTELSTSEDWVFIVDVAQYGDIAFIDRSLIKYRISDDQMSSIENNGRLIAENTLKASLFLLRQHPEYFLKHKKRTNRMLVDRYLNVADLSIDINRFTAIENWLKSLSYFFITSRHFKLAIKIFTPDLALVLYRKIKRIF